jgi:pectate lyase
MLLSASPQAAGDRVMRVTLHHNYFRRTDERHPRLRFGKVHAYNNLYEAWRSYGAAASMYGELFSQANVFDAWWFHREAIVAHKGRDPAPGYVRSVDDLVTGGARIEVREPERVFDPMAYYPTTGVEPADDRLRAAVRAGAGWREVRIAEEPAPGAP